MSLLATRASVAFRPIAAAARCPDCDGDTAEPYPDHARGVWCIEVRHESSCPWRRSIISRVCADIDRRLGNHPGTAERGLWFWLWPPPVRPDDDVLTRLHADAIEFLHTITDPKETPP